MTKPVGGEAVLLQPSLLPGAEPRRGAEAGAMPAEGFALLLAGMLGGSAAAAPTPTTDPAPAPAPPRQAAGALPWDVLAAAAEETGRLAAAFQMPLAAMPPAVEEGAEAPGLAPSALAPPEAASTLPEGTPAPALAAALAPPPAPPRPAAPALPSLSAVQDPTPASDSLEMLPAGGPSVKLPPDLPPGSLAAPPGALPEAPATAPAAILARGPISPPGTPAAGTATPATAPALPSAPPAPAEESPVASPVASSASLADAPSLAEAEAPAALPPPPAGAASPPAALLQEAQAFAAVPAPQRRPSLMVTSAPPANGPPAGPEAAAAAPHEAVARLLPTAIAAPAQPHEGNPHPFTPPDEAVAVLEKSMPEQGLPLAPPAPDPLPEPQPALTPAVSGTVPGPAPLPSAPTFLPGQAPMPQSRLAAEAAPQLVLRMAQAAKKDGVETISVDLRPPELGRVELQMTFRDGAVQVVMRAEQPDTFEALRHERHSLMQQMEQAGLQLGGSGLDLQQGPLPQPKPEQAFASARSVAADPEQEAEAQAEAARAPRPAASDSLIDIIT